MWFDRFASSIPTQPSTQTPSRSPLPRRPTQLEHQAGLSRANSSYSETVGSSAFSTANRKPALSGLRQEQHRTEDVQDPLLALKALLDDSKSRRGDGDDVSGLETAILPVDLDTGGLTLEEYARDDSAVDRQQASSGGSFARTADVQSLNRLHTSIEETSQILNSVEAYLVKFRGELGQVSTEIQGLQSRSIELDSQLENRRKVEKLLGPHIESISISPATVIAVADGPIDEHFAKALTEVEARLLKVREIRDHSKLLTDTRPLLENLTNRAVERIRDFFVAQIKSIRSPGVNVQVIQQQSFLKHKELYPFLSRRSAQLADEITQAYVNTVRWYYASNFTRYSDALAKMQIHQVDENDLIGAEHSIKKSSSKTGSGHHEIFQLGKRADVLRMDNDRALPSYILEDARVVHYIETPFQNYNQVLLDNLTAEYTVATELFSTASYQQVYKRVSSTFEGAFLTGHDLTRRLVQHTTDCIGILVCIRLNQRYAFQAQKRKVPVMDDYVNLTNILLWPRLQKVMDMHCESLRKISATGSRSTAAAFSLVGGQDSTKASVAPHAITQRYGQFLHAILAVSTEAEEGEPLVASLSRLRAEYDSLMQRLAKVAGDAAKRQKFLYNNYVLVATIISDSRGKLAAEHKEHLSELIHDLKQR